MFRLKFFPISVVMFFAALIILPLTVFAVPSTSTNYRLDPDAFNTTGGQGTSTNYKLLSSVGEALIGNGEGGSYKLTSGYISQLDQSIELSVNPSGLIAHYPLDTNAGKVAYDISSNDRHASFGGSPSWSTGKINSGLTFDGAPDLDYLAAPIPSSNAAMTWGAWVKPGSVSWQQTILALGAAATNDIIITSAGKVQANFTVGGINRSITSSTTLSVGTWYYVSASYTGTTMTLYINGVSEGTPINSLSGTIAATGLYAGRRGVATEGYLSGDLDEIMIFDRGLDATEIRDIYNAQSAGIRNAQTIPQITPGVSKTTTSDITVLTDAGGYDLAISQNNNLTHTDTSTTIPSLSGASIASPNAWDEGNSKGLGFTLTSGNSLPVKWGTNPNFHYAAIPSSGTTFHSRTGFTGGVKEVTVMQYRLDVATSQKAGSYTNTVTITATTKP